MESTDDDDGLKLIKASAGLLTDLEDALPTLFWKRAGQGPEHGRVHSQVRRQDLDRVTRLIETFQGEPQLLDVRLKYILAPIVDAFARNVQLKQAQRREKYVDLQTAICIILYTLCKVRGYKIVVGFLNNEPRYLEPVLLRLEDTTATEDQDEQHWQSPYILLLWLSHLLLTPFDLVSISDAPDSKSAVDRLDGGARVPPIATRILSIGLRSLRSSTKAQDAAAVLLVRLVRRPDMQRSSLADHVTTQVLDLLQGHTSESHINIYQRLGILRFLAGTVNSAELAHLIPRIYHACEKLSSNEASFVHSNAVAKKLMLKIFRNITIIGFRSESTHVPLLDFREDGVLENIIDYILRSLGDRDTPVRYAAAKAIGIVVLKLEDAMGHEIIQAVLESFREDSPRNGETLDFRTVDALRWHGLTLALAHTLFKRSASPEQLSDIVSALISALQFEQRTATGSSVGTNVRDAANFGIWSLSRRYTTDELLSVDLSIGKPGEEQSVIQSLAIQLILSACLDPSGNIRRGSSAALQELIGRHPNQVHEGIALVQIVDYQAVGLRRRAMVDVSRRASDLSQGYWKALTDALFGWRGLGSFDVPSREAAAASLAGLSQSQSDDRITLLVAVSRRLQSHSIINTEGLHGLILSLACLLENNTHSKLEQSEHKDEVDFKAVIDILQASTKDFTPRILRSELPASTARLLAAITGSLMVLNTNEPDQLSSLPSSIETITERLLNRQEENIQAAIPPLVQSLLPLKRNASAPLGCLGAQTLCKRVAMDGSKSTLTGTGRAVALGALAPLYSSGLQGEKAIAALKTLASLTDAMNVDWRIIGVKAILIAVESIGEDIGIDPSAAETIARAVHRGMNDYSIDERGDVGSLVRLQAIACAYKIFETPAIYQSGDLFRILHADIYRLSLEKLDRVRLAAAQCRRQHLGFGVPAGDVTSVSSNHYFVENLKPLTDDCGWEHKALLEGCISCAGISAEPLLQASREALIHLLNDISQRQLLSLMTIFVSILKSQLSDSSNMHPPLELLSFLLDMQILQRLGDSDFKWRNLLSTVQKSHHQSNDIPKIMAAIRVYRGLAGIGVIRNEVLKKLVSMLKTNPYPKVRSYVAEISYDITRDAAMKHKDWTKSASGHMSIIEHLQGQYVNG